MKDLEGRSGATKLRFPTLWKTLGSVANRVGRSIHKSTAANCSGILQIHPSHQLQLWILPAALNLLGTSSISDNADPIAGVPEQQLLLFLELLLMQDIPLFALQEITGIVMLQCSNEKAYPMKPQEFGPWSPWRILKDGAVVLRGVVYSSWRDWRCFTKLMDVEWDAWGEAKKWSRFVWVMQWSVWFAKTSRYMLQQEEMMESHWLSERSKVKKHLSYMVCWCFL